jgi:hypothetical protein
MESQMPNEKGLKNQFITLSETKQIFGMVLEF